MTTEPTKQCFFINFHNEGADRLGCIGKALRIEPDNNILVKIAKIATIFFTGIANLIGLFFEWCRGSVTVLTPADMNPTENPETDAPQATDKSNDTVTPPVTTGTVVAVVETPKEEVVATPTTEKEVVETQETPKEEGVETSTTLVVATPATTVVDDSLLLAEPATETDGYLASIKNETVRMGNVAGRSAAYVGAVLTSYQGLVMMAAASTVLPGAALGAAYQLGAFAFGTGLFAAGVGTVKNLYNGASVSEVPSKLLSVMDNLGQQKLTEVRDVD